MQHLQERGCENASGRRRHGFQRAVLERRKAMLPIKEDPHLHSPQSSPRRHRVLLVDEDAKDLKYFTSLLERMGYSVQAFTDHREAEGCLEHGYFDLVILSQSSAVLEAHRLKDFTWGRNRYTSVVVLARCPEIECYVEAMQLGAADYLGKPLSPVELERLVATYCNPRQGGISPHES